ncbi:MAG: choice-of-anchor Q domain-containing protein [Pseudomarimonas sp.]
MLGAGVFGLSLPSNPRDDASGGDLDVFGNLRLIGAGPEITTIESLVVDRLLHVRAEAVALVHGVTLLGGESGSSGGAVRVDAQGTLELADCRVSNSSVFNGFSGATDGGGIANAGTLRIERCVIHDNRISGGVVTNGGGIYNVGSTTIRHSRINGNRVTGGGLGNTGGGISSRGELFLIGSMVESNESFGQSGGLDLSGIARIESSTIANNLASRDGGGLSLAQSETLVELVNSTISGNQASGDAGGVRLLVGTLILRSSTVTANVADANNNGIGNGGGVVVNSGTLRASNTIIAGNVVRQNTDSGVDCIGPLVSEGHLLLGEAAGCMHEIAEGDVAGVDPQLLPLGDNGGPTPTHAPAANSPVIDAGPACLGLKSPPGFDEPTLFRDQRGFPRPIDGNGDGISTCDIGAVEHAPNRIHGSGFEPSEAPVPSTP